MLPGRRQTCPDFELRWCCPIQNQVLSDTQLNNSVDYANYTIDDLPTTSNLRYIEISFDF